MAAENAVRGVARDLARAQEDGRMTLRFWLYLTDGRKIPVEAHWDEAALQDNDMVEVTGASDAEGTIQATALRKIAAPPKPPEPQPSIRWLMVLLAAVLGRVLSWAITVLPAELKAKKPLPTTNFWLAMLLSVAVVNLKVKERRGLHSGLAVAGAVVLALILGMTKC
jgi:hypothetical protein